MPDVTFKEVFLVLVCCAGVIVLLMARFEAEIGIMLNGDYARGTVVGSVELPGDEDEPPVRRSTVRFVDAKGWTREFISGERIAPAYRENEVFPEGHEVKVRYDRKRPWNAKVV